MTAPALFLLLAGAAAAAPPARTFEEKRLPSLKGVVEREGDTLKLERKGKLVRALTDSLTDDEKAVAYTLTAVDEANKTATIDVQYYEGGSVLLFDYGRGRVVDVGGKPVWSPSGRRFAVVQCDEAGYGPPRMSLWALEPKAIKREWPARGQEGCGFAARWKGDDEVEFEWGSPAPDGARARTTCRRAKRAWRCIERL